MADVNVKELNTFFHEQLHAEHVAHAESVAGAPAGAMMMASLPDLAQKAADLSGTFCDLWPKVKATILQALAMLAWVPFVSKYAAAAKAAISTIDKFLVPLVCSTPASAETVQKKS